VSLTVPELQRLSALLDEALALTVADRERWIDALPAELQTLAPTLRRLLERQAGAEAGDPLDRGPAVLSLTPLGAGGDEEEAADRRQGLRDEPFVEGQCVGPYRLRRPLGAGGMGEVWLAERSDGTLRRPVALKLPLAGLRRGVLAQRLRRERDILAALEHPHIARLYDAGTAQDGQPFLALEYVEGEPITRHCDERALGARERVALLRQVMDAVQYAHAHLVVHRDLKPSNVLVRADGRAMLLDFGIAKLLQDEQGGAAASELTRLGGRALTPRYAAPEQVAAGLVSTATDVWALGVLLYELLAARPPFGGATAHEIERAVLDAEPTRPSAWHAGAMAGLGRSAAADLDTIVLKALRKPPPERYATVAAFADDLDRWLRGAPVRAQPDSAAYRLRKFAARHRAGVAIGVGVAATVVAASAVSLWQAGRARAEAARALAVQEFVLDLFHANTADQPDPQRARRTTARELLDLGAARLAGAFVDQPEARLILLETLGRLYAELGLWAEASRLSGERLALARRLSDASDTRLAAALIDHARALDVLDRDSRTEVMPLIDEAGQVLAAAGASGGLLQARLHVLASDHLMGLDPTEALRRAELGVALFRRLDDVRPGLDDALESLANAHNRRGDRALAITVAEEALQVARERGRQEVHVARLLRRVGELHGFAGSPRAEPLLREALAMAERVHGPNGPGTVLVRISLARHLAMSGRTAEARVLADRALADATQTTLGGEPFQIQEVRRLVFEIYLTQMDFGAARVLVDRAFADFGPSAPDSFQHADLLVDRAIVEMVEQRLEAAGHTLAAAAAMVRRLGFAETSPMGRTVAQFEAEWHLARGDAVAALARLDAMQAAAGPGAADVRPQSLRARALAAAGRTEEAAAWVDAGLREIENAPDREQRADLEAALLLVRAELQRRGGGCAAAQPALARAVALYARLHVATSPRLVEAERSLAECRGRAPPPPTRTRTVAAGGPR
jgi:serine/threonine-protein kinase